MRIPGFLGEENTTAVWLVRIGLIIFECVLIFFVIRLLSEWNNGRPIYLLLAAACLALLFATKETAFITLGTMAIACVCIWAREQIAVSARAKMVSDKDLCGCGDRRHCLRVDSCEQLPDIGKDFGRWAFELTKAGTADSFVNIFYFAVAVLPATFVYLLYAWDKSGSASEIEADSSRISLAAFCNGLGTGGDRALIIAASVALIVYLTVLFFSSFFTYAAGVNAFFEAYAIWLKTGSKDHTQNGIWAYIDWGMKSDSPIMILSLVGLLIALMKGKNRFAMFAGLWAFGLFLAYSIIPYKTPWLALSFLLPMCIAAGYAIGEVLEPKFLDAKANAITKALGYSVAVMSISLLAYFTYDLNFVRYDDEDAPMVYAHTQREFLDMVADIERFAAESGKGKETAIDIVSPDYWPLVWYLKDYPKAVFHGRIADSTAEMIVAKKNDQDADVKRMYSGNYDYYASYKLRSGVDLVLLVRKDLAGR